MNKYEYNKTYSIKYYIFTIFIKRGNYGSKTSLNSGSKNSLNANSFSLFWANIQPKKNQHQIINTMYT